MEQRNIRLRELLIEGDPSGQNISVANCYALQNDIINTGLDLGATISVNRTFSDVDAVLNKAFTYRGNSYTTALFALNAWVSSQNDGITYIPWHQLDMYPCIQTN